MEGEITFQTCGSQNDFGDFFKAADQVTRGTPTRRHNQLTDQAAVPSLDQTITTQASTAKMADVVNVPLLHDFAVQVPSWITT